MRQLKWFILIAFIYITIYAFHAVMLQKTVYGDGIYYFSWVRSMIIDHDANFTNEYSYFKQSQEYTPKGLLANKYSIGPALLWAPPYTVIHSIIKGTGFTFPYQFAIGLTSVFYTLIGLVLMHRLLLQKYTEKVASLTVLAIALASHFLFYGSIDTVNSHALSFFSVTLFLSFLFAKNINWFLVGCTLGLIGLIRPQDLVYGILLIPSLFKKHNYHLVTTSYYLIAGFLITIIPQLIAWQKFYGQFLVSPYFIGGESFSIWQPHIVEVLFNITNGLFVWTPLFIIGIIGLLISRSSLKFYLLLIFVVQLFLVSTWSSWNQGASFSGRMFISTLPFIGFGLGEVFSWLSKKGWETKMFISILILPLSALNLLAIVYFLLTRP